MKKLKLIILYCIAMIVALTVVGIRYFMLPFHKIYEWADDWGRL